MCNSYFLILINLMSFEFGKRKCDFLVEILEKSNGKHECGIGGRAQNTSKR